MKSDAQLVSLAIAGKRSAFEELVLRHEKSMRAFAWHLLHDHHAAEDVTQEAFVAAFKSLPRLRDRNAFGFWVREIVRRQSFDASRRRRVTVPLEAAGEVAAPDATTDFDAERLLKALMALPPPEQQVLMLRHFDGHEVRAIAQILGRSVGTITKRLSRGHARLRERLQEYQP